MLSDGNSKREIKKIIALYYQIPSTATGEIETLVTVIHLNNSGVRNISDSNPFNSIERLSSDFFKLNIALEGWKIKIMSNLLGNATRSHPMASEGSIQKLPITVLLFFVNLKIIQLDADKLKIECVSAKCNIRPVCKNRTKKDFKVLSMENTTIYAVLAAERDSENDGASGSTFIHGSNIFSVQELSNEFFDFNINQFDLFYLYLVYALDETVADVTAETKGKYEGSFVTYYEKFRGRKVNDIFQTMLKEFSDKFNGFQKRDDFRNVIMKAEVVGKVLVPEIVVIVFLVIYLISALFRFQYFNDFLLLCYAHSPSLVKTFSVPYRLNFKQS